MAPLALTQVAEAQPATKLKRTVSSGQASQEEIPWEVMISEISKDSESFLGVSLDEEDAFWDGKDEVEFRHIHPQGRDGEV
jgi:hypothetical protein